MVWFSVVTSLLTFSFVPHCQVMEKHGVTRFSPMNERFDPHRHNALFEMPSAELEPGIVCQGVMGISSLSFQSLYLFFTREQRSPCMPMFVVACQSGAHQERMNIHTLLRMFVFYILTEMCVRACILPSWTGVRLASIFFLCILCLGRGRTFLCCMYAKPGKEECMFLVPCTEPEKGTSCSFDACGLSL